jgi:hypothetical protein
VHPARGDQFDVFTARAIVKGEQAAGPVDPNQCRLAFPS